MNYFEISGIVISAIIATLGIFKMELIKSLVNRITEDKGKINLFSIIILLLIVIVPTIIGYNIPEVKSDDKNDEIKVEQKIKSKEEVYLEAGKEVVALGKELVDNVKTNKHKKDSIFNATRNQRWVFQIGEAMDNGESILETYNILSDKENICLFKNKGKYILFKNEFHSKHELDSLYGSFKSQIKSIVVSKVDLMSFCKNKKETLIKTEKEKIGRGKNKVWIDCYETSK